MKIHQHNGKVDKLMKKHEKYIKTTFKINKSMNFNQ